MEKTPNYKHSFLEKSDYGNYSVLTKQMWDIACCASVKQADLIVNRKQQCSYGQFIKDITQLNIYHAQKLYYINAAEERLLALLNSMPLFLVEYFDVNFWNRVMVK